MGYRWRGLGLGIAERSADFGTGIMGSHGTPLPPVQISAGSYQPKFSTVHLYNSWPWLTSI